MFASLICFYSTAEAMQMRGGFFVQNGSSPSPSPNSEKELSLSGAL